VNIRTSLVVLTALAAMATTSLSATPASAWGGDRHYGEIANNGPGFGGAPNSAVTHPDPHVPGATLPPGGPRPMPSAPHPIPSAGGGSPNPSGNGGVWNHRPWATNPLSGGRDTNNRLCDFGGCPGDGWSHPWWRHHVWGPTGYPTQTPGYPTTPAYPTTPVYTPTPVYTQAPTYTAPTPTYIAPAPTYTAPTPTYAAPTPTYAAPTPTYAAPAPTYTAAPAQPVSQNCNCVTKSYMQDGTVVFTDVCTKETAMAAPAGWQQGQPAPQQSTY
jgi:hypothetical protein